MKSTQQSADVADEERLFFHQDEEEESEREVFARKAICKQPASDKKEPQNLSTEVIEVVNTPLNTAVYAFGAIEENARTRNEQDFHPLLKALNFSPHYTERCTNTLESRKRSMNAD